MTYETQPRKILLKYYKVSKAWVQAATNNMRALPFVQGATAFVGRGSCYYQVMVYADHDFTEAEVQQILDRAQEAAHKNRKI